MVIVGGGGRGGEGEAFILHKLWIMSQKKLYKFPKLGVVGGINLGNARKKTFLSY